MLSIFICFFLKCLFLNFCASFTWCVLCVCTKPKPIEAGFQYNEITQKRFLYSILIHHKRKKTKQDVMTPLFCFV
jgi:hypothetical protein